jgi:hypothetical protein
LQTMKLMMGTKNVNPKEKTTWGNATLWKKIETRWRSKVVNIDGAIFNNNAFAKALLEKTIEAPLFTSLPLLVFMTLNVHTFNGLFASPNISSFLSFTCIIDLAWEISWSGEAPWVKKKLAFKWLIRKLHGGTQNLQHKP